jgi:cytochrome b
MRQSSQPLWDLPTRAFHWLIVCCLPLAWWSGETDNYDIHQWLGYTVIVLVISRVAWGVMGSRHSRFSDFVVSPVKVLAYMRGQGADSAGHNPLGGWSVLVLLLLLLIQAISGLFNSDDVLFSGPLYYAASTGFRDTMGQVHEIAFYVLLALVCLHITVVMYHQLRHREKLLQAMISGSAPGREGTATPVSWWWAVVVVLVVALGLWWGLEQAPQPASIVW